MNLGLSDNLKSEFKNFTPVERPLIKTTGIHNPNWISGFTTAEGNFSIKILSGKTHKKGYRVQLMFRVNQHERDKALIEHFTKYLESGKVYKYIGKPAYVYTVFKFSDIHNIIIPFFEFEVCCKQTENLPFEYQTSGNTHYKE